jgi:hypothetical protein
MCLAASDVVSVLAKAVLNNNRTIASFFIHARLALLSLSVCTGWLFPFLLMFHLLNHFVSNLLAFVEGVAGYDKRAK